jgi:ATP-binding cassette subfamily B protein
MLLAISSLNGFILLKFIDYITLTATQVSSGEIFDISSIIIKTMPFILSLLATNLVAQYYSIYKIRFNTQIDEYLNSKIKKKLGIIHYDYYESSMVYEKLNRVNEKVVGGYNTAIDSIVKIVEILFYMSFYIIYLMKINIVFSVLVILSIFFSGIIATKMSKSKHKMFVDITKLNQKRDYLDQLPKDKIAHQEYQSGRLFESIFQKYREAYTDAQKGYLKIHRYTIFAEAKALLLFVITILFSYLYLSFQITNGITTVGVVVSLMIIFDNLYGRSEALSYYISNRIEDLLIVNEYYEIMNYNEVQISSQYSLNNSGIKFVNVSYCYPQSDIKALDQLNIEIKNGEKIAIVGENGSGKTTFSNILLGLLTEFDGNVIIGNQEYSKQNPPPIQMVQSLSQDFTMYQTSIRNNILFGEKGELTYEKLSDILDTVGIGEFVNTLPNKSETFLGQLEDEGIELSKGQEQKIAAARIIANSKTPVWILDEPTAYLDPLAEIDMYKYLYKLSNEKTVLFISHRLGFAPMADRIIVFDRGKVVEIGTHEELIRCNGIYAKMYEAQKSWYGAN